MHAEMHARKVYGDVWRDPGCQEFIRAQESCFAATVLPQNLLSGKFAVCNTEGGQGSENAVGEDGAQPHGRVLTRVSVMAHAARLRELSAGRCFPLLHLFARSHPQCP